MLAIPLTTAIAAVTVPEAQAAPPARHSPWLSERQGPRAVHLIDTDTARDEPPRDLGVRHDVRMTEPWVEVATKRLRDQHACPECGTNLTSNRCEGCGLLLSGPWATEVLRASRDAAVALDRRTAALGLCGPPTNGPVRRVPSCVPWRDPCSRSGQPAAPRRTPAHPGADRPADVGHRHGNPPGSFERRSATHPRERRAGLLAVATIVFVFFTLADDLAVRALVTGVVTLLALGSAAFLRVRGMGASAESIGALGVVLLLVDVELLLSARLLGTVDPTVARGPCCSWWRRASWRPGTACACGAGARPD
ncbi:hypothetical protein NKG05_14430 [Oerskovia sp. M15]